MEKIQEELSNNYNKYEFMGVMIDTGAKSSSLMSLNQYMTFCREFNTPLEIKKIQDRWWLRKTTTSNYWKSYYTNFIPRYTNNMRYQITYTYNTHTSFTKWY